MSPPLPARPHAALSTQGARAGWTNAGRPLCSVTGCSTRRRSRRLPPICAPQTPISRRSSRHMGFPSSGPASPGFPTLVLLILEQQVSLASAKAAYDRLEARLGGVTPDGIVLSSDEELRADGFSRQKNRYVRALSAALLDGSLDLDAVALLDDDGVRQRTRRAPGDRPMDGGGLPPLRAPAARHVARRGHRPAGGRSSRAAARRAPVAVRARGDRRGVAAAPRERGAPALAPLPQRAAAERPARGRPLNIR